MNAPILARRKSASDELFTPGKANSQSPALPRQKLRGVGFSTVKKRAAL